MTYQYKYPRPALTVDALVLANTPEGNYLLLIQRKNPPFQDSWALPGGFMDMDETLEKAAKRELEEETGLVCDHLQQFKSYSAVDRDPRGRTVSVVFWEELSAIPETQAGDDAKEAQWFLLEQLPELAFDHQNILDEFKSFWVSHLDKKKDC